MLEYLRAYLDKVDQEFSFDIIRNLILLKFFKILKESERDYEIVTLRIFIVAISCLLTNSSVERD